MRSSLRLSLLALLVASPLDLLAENRLFIDAQTVQIGQTDVAIPVKLNNDQVLYGFQLSIKTSNVSALQITDPGIDLVGAVVPDAGWSFGQILESGTRLSWGVVLDVSDPFDVSKVIPVGQGLHIANVRVDVVATAAGSASISFEDVPAAPPAPSARNVLVSDQGERVPVTTAAGTITIEEGGRSFVRGNSNGQSDIDISDAVFHLNYLFLGGNTPPCLDASDVDDNGVLEITDAIRLLNFLFLGGQAPAPPYPNPGKDPTEEPPDTLDCQG